MVAKKVGVTCLNQRQFEDADLTAHDLILMLSYDSIIPPDRLRLTRFVNFHNGLLPQYRGARSNVWPILNGESSAGVTCHAIWAQLDAGPIIATRSFSLSREETGRSLYRRLAAASILLFRDKLELLVAGAYQEVTQDACIAHLYKKISVNFESVEIDFSRGSSFVERFVRALYFPEFQTARFRSRSVLRVAVTDRVSDLPPGMLTGMQVDGWQSVATSDLDVKLQLSD